MLGMAKLIAPTSKILFEHRWELNRGRGRVENNVRQFNENYNLQVARIGSWNDYISFLVSGN